MYRKFKKSVLDFCKENGVTLQDIKDEIRTLDMELSTTSKDRTFGRDYGLEDPDYVDLGKLHDNIVQEIIDYLGSHPGLKLEDNKKKIWNEWGGSDLLIPDIDVTLSVSGLSQSVMEGKWTPSTDSYMSIQVGGVEIIGRG